MTSSLPVSPAKTSAAPENRPVSPEPVAACSTKSSAWLGSFDLNSSSLRTLQISCLTPTGRRSKKSSTKLPKQGLMQSGQLFQHQTWAPATAAPAAGLLPTPVAQTSQGGPKGLDGGSAARRMLAYAGFPRAAGSPTPLLPTPRANDAEKRGNFDPFNPRNGLPAVARLLPIPTTRDHKDGSQQACANTPSSGLSGREIRNAAGSTQTGDPMYLNPSFVEEMMGFPVGWTA
jgi:hypothetical protein